MENLTKNFFEKNEFDFCEYFENYRKENLLNEGTYKNIIKKIKKISEEYPRAINYIEDGPIGELSLQELKAAYNILELREEIETIEFKESFRCGFKEAFKFMKEMGLINI